MKKVILKLLRHFFSESDLNLWYSRLRVCIYKSNIYQRLTSSDKSICECSNADEMRFFFLGTPVYGNLGDQAIAYAQIQFLKKECCAYEIIEVPDNVFYKNLAGLKRNIKKQDIIVMIGGGNMGERYYLQEAIRQTVVESFRENKIVIFPQTIEYGRNNFARKVLNRSKKVFGNHKHLVIAAREKTSYEMLKKIYPQNKILLTPDIVLYLKLNNFLCDRKDVLLCLRHDVERKISDIEEIQIKEFLELQEECIIETDTIINRDIRVEDRKYELVKKWKEFASAKIVVTDRLHGMIFAVITGTPCVVFRNVNHKIEGVYQWVKVNKTVELVDSVEDMKNCYSRLLKVMESNNVRTDSMNQAFSVLSDAINS